MKFNKIRVAGLGAVVAIAGLLAAAADSLSAALCTRPGCTIHPECRRLQAEIGLRSS